MTVVDAYDVLRTGKFEKEMLPHEEALKKMKTDMAGHFDPDILAAFEKSSDEICKVAVNTG